MSFDPSNLTVEQRIEALERLVSTSLTAHTNAICALIDTVRNIPGSDHQQLIHNLKQAQEAKISGLDEKLYRSTFDLFLNRQELRSV